MIKALARAFRWRKLLETGVYGTIEEIAAAEKINSSYVGRVLRLTLLAPEIVEAILDGLQQVELTLATLMRPFAVPWDDQRTAVEMEEADRNPTAAVMDDLAADLLCFRRLPSIFASPSVAIPDFILVVLGGPAGLILPGSPM